MDRQRGVGVGALLLLVLLAMMAWAASIAWREHDLSAAIAALPVSERGALYRHTVEELSTVCTAPPERLLEHCTHQAQLALKFPECDGDCRARATALLERPRR
jgi:hypothetical protein